MSETIDLEVLNTGSGHLRLTYDPGEPEEVKKAKATIDLMLRRGFAIFVPDGKHTRRVRAFDPTRGCYLVDAAPDAAERAEAAADERSLASKDCWCGRPNRHRGRHAKTKALPAQGRKAVAVGRTAGG